jgi:RNA polymerase sigma factor (sigma-70 family)
MDSLAGRFEERRPHLRSVAYRMLGSLDDADDAVQETWLRLSRQGGQSIESLDAWLTQVCARISVDMLRTRRSKREQPLEPTMPDFIVSREADPETSAIQADQFGLAATIVIDTLSPSERLAFVLHDMFALPFEEIAPIVDRTPLAARQLASRARRRVQGALPAASTFGEQRAVVNAFVAAAREGDVAGIVAVLDPNVLLRADRAPALHGIRGAGTVASQAASFSRVVGTMEPVVVNGAPGLLSWLPSGEPLSITGFVVEHSRIREMYIVSLPASLRRILEK